MKLKYWQAVNRALREEMEADESVVLIGQDVGPGGTFGSTRKLLEQFGPERVRDVAIAEQAMVGSGVGAALMGMRPVVEVLVIDFLMLAMDPLINQAAKYDYFTAGQTNVPLVIKAGIGTGIGMGTQHSQNLEAWFAHVPGLKVVWPGATEDVGGILKAAIRDDGPVVFMESIGSYREVAEVATPIDPIPLGVARIVASGTDVTLVTYGSALATCKSAMAMLAEAGVSVELVDLRSLAPWDRETVLSSVARTRRCVIVHDAVGEFGLGAEIASVVGEECFNDLIAPPIRVASPRVPSPHVTRYENMRRPDAKQVVAAVQSVLRRTSQEEMSVVAR